MSTRWTDIAFPWGPDLLTLVEPKEDADVLRTSLINILLTSQGERVMRPLFGSGILDAVFDQNDPTLVAQLKSRIEEAITAWDDRIEFIEVQGERDHEELTLKIVCRNARDPTQEGREFLAIEFSGAQLSVL